MVRTPKARHAILTALQAILIESGDGAATLESVAVRAGVTKNGLLYHFKSRKELFDALLRHVESAVGQDITAMRTDPDGPVAHYLRMSDDAESPVNKGLAAIARLPPPVATKAAALMAATQNRWRAELATEVTDPAVAAMIAVIGDGLWQNASMRHRWPEHRPPASVDDIMRVLRRAAEAE